MRSLERVSRGAGAPGSAGARGAGGVSSVAERGLMAQGKTNMPPVDAEEDVDEIAPVVCDPAQPFALVDVESGVIVQEIQEGEDRGIEPRRGR